jgi:hypothetical protein
MYLVSAALAGALTEDVVALALAVGAVQSAR